MIPKTVYQTWISKDLPSFYADIVHHNRQMNPDYEFSLWDEKEMEDFMNSSDLSPRIKQAFFRLNPHYGPARSDLFRYSIIYLYGGIYLDIKIKIQKPFHEWIPDHYDFLYSYWNHGREIANWYLIFSPQHPILGKLLDSISSSILCIPDDQDWRGKADVLKLTGPIPYTRIMESNLSHYRSFSIQPINHYLSYGNHFLGIPIQGYKHYSKVEEPLLLSIKSPIPDQFYLQRYIDFNIPGIYVFANNIELLRPFETIFHHCDVCFAKNDQDQFTLLAFHHQLKKFKNWSFFLSHGNQESIYRYSHLLFKQIKMEEAKIGKFHHVEVFRIK